MTMFRSRVSPTHVAFKAENQQIVRQCYSAAIRARGLPGAEPNYRHSTCSCYNAAVEDLDGHKIEFIFRQPHGEHFASDHRCDDAVATSEDAKPVKEDAWEEEPEQSSSDSSTARGMNGKNMLGLGVAAVAGAALVYSMVATERKNARDEADYLASRKSSTSMRRAPPVMVETLPAAPPMRELPEPKPRHRRNFSTTESNYSAVRSQHVLALEEEPFERPDNLIDLYSARRAPIRRVKQEYVYMPPPSTDDVSSYTVHRAQTLPLEDTAPRYLLEAPRSSVSSQKSSRHAESRHAESRHAESRHAESTPRSHAPSMHSSRRSHHSSNSSTRDGRKLSRHDSGIEIPDASREEQREAKVEKARDHVKSSSAAGSVRSARREPSVHSAAKASTHVDTTSYWPAGVPLPPSVSGYSVASKSSRRSARLRPASYYESAVEVPLPGSTTSRSNYTASKACAIPLPESRTGVEDWEDEAGSGYDNDDNITVAELAPHDSISCVGLPRQEPRRRRRHSHRPSHKEDGESATSRYQDAPSRHSHRREREELEVVEESGDDHSPRFVPLLRKIGVTGGSRAGSVTRHSVMTLPVRTRTPVSMVRRVAHSHTR
jgi:hypothetical protein